jgi:hypothetical protein
MSVIGWVNLAGNAVSGGASVNAQGPALVKVGTTIQFNLDDPSNMLYNAGGELSPSMTGWTTTGTVAQSTDFSFNGTQSIKFSTTSASAQQTARAEPGDQYTATAKILSAAGTNGLFILGLSFLDKTLQVVGQQLLTPSPTGGVWTSQQTPAVIAPANTAWVQYLLVAGSNFTTGAWYVDTCTLRRINKGDTVALGVLTNSHLVAGTRAIQVSGGLPTIPSPNYPLGIVIFNVVDGHYYKTKNGSNWTDIGKPEDFAAGTLAAGVVIAGSAIFGTLDAGAVNVINLNATNIVAGSLVGITVTLASNGITTYLDNNIYNSGLANTYYGLRTTDSGGHSVTIYSTAIIGDRNISGTVVPNWGLLSDDFFGGSLQLRGLGVTAVLKSSTL